MIYRAVEVIWIFLAGRAGRAGIEGTIRGPRGPQKLTFLQIYIYIELFINVDFDYLYKSQ